jgi:hypothetical protein
MIYNKLLGFMVMGRKQEVFAYIFFYEGREVIWQNC